MNEEIEKKQVELKNEIYEDLKKYLTWNDYMKLTQWLNHHNFLGSSCICKISWFSSMWFGRA